MSHCLTTSTPTNNLTFKAIFKELVSSVIGNRKAFCPKPQNVPKPTSQPSTSGVSPTATPVVAIVTSTSLPPNTSKPTPSAASSGSTSLPNNPSRGSSETRHQAGVSQGANFKVTHSLTRGASFPVTIAGINCNALIDTSATRSCISEIFYNQLMLPWLLKASCGNFCPW